MATLIYNAFRDMFMLTESDRDKPLHEKDFLCRRNMCAFFQYENDTCLEKVLGLFGIADLFDCEMVDSKRDDQFIIAKDVNPYVMKINGRCFVYFGEDMPVVKSKSVLKNTKHFKFWTGDYIYKKPEYTTYYYAEVKEPKKLLCFYNCHYDFTDGERLVEFNNRANPGCLRPEAMIDYIARLDYTEERWKEYIDKKIEAEKKAREEAARRAEELEERKKKPGFCSCCGSPDAHKTVNPYNVERFDDYTPVWLCKNCYNDYLNDI